MVLLPNRIIGADDAVCHDNQITNYLVIANSFLFYLRQKALRMVNIKWNASVMSDL